LFADIIFKQMLQFLSRFWNWYISGFSSHPDKALYESPRFWRIVLTFIVFAWCSQLTKLTFAVWILPLGLLCLVGLAFWAFLTPSGQEFLRQYSRSQQASIVANNKLTSIAEGVLQKSNFQLLMNEFNGLSTFSAVVAWDERANIELQSLIDGIQLFDSEINRQSKILNEQRIETYKTKYRVLMENMAEKLQESIDFTPNSSTEQKSLLKELRQRKKELQLEKREVAASAKQIREKARLKSIHAGRVLGIIYDSKLAAIERRAIRYGREAAVAPHENVKASIERQILQIDKDILWVERFTD
jgi:hypothetical protein